MRALSPVEAALGVAVVGSVLAVGVPAFFENLHASRLAEPIDGLGAIAAAALALAEAGEPFPASVQLTPGQVAAGQALVDEPGTWDQPTWQALGFGFDGPHRFSFAFESTRGGLAFRAVARGDLDGDGQHSELSLRGEQSAAGARTFPLEMQREVE
jgi:hypothetical protein